MITRPRIYFDNAATSWPKPPAVYEAVDDYQRRLGTGVARGGYAEAREVGDRVEGLRASLAQLIGAGAPEQIVFTFNGTDSLNLAIHGALRPGDHVVTTVVEHNSVLRPLRWLEDCGRIEVSRVGCDGEGIVDPDEIRRAITPRTKLIVLNHVSNVTGTIQPAAEVGKIARDYGLHYLVDAAQSAGHLDINVEELQADFLAAPGHKGLLGPLGTGFLYVRRGGDQLLTPIRQGGTGTLSATDRQPNTLPQKYESGNHNALGLVGLNAGIKYVIERGLADIRSHSQQLTRRLLQGLAALPAVEVYGPRDETRQIGIVSIGLPGFDSGVVAAALEQWHRIQTRAGFQCAALLHRVLGTTTHGGVVRFSIGVFNTDQEIDAAIEAVNEIARDEVPRRVHAVECPCVGHSQSAVEPSEIAAGRVLAARCSEANCQAEPIMRSSRVEELLPGLTDLWRETLGDSQVRIAILDGPVDMNHPSLRNANLTMLGHDLATTTAGGAASHGTHVASIIFGHHGSAIQGIAPQCSGLIRPIYRDAEDGSVVNATQHDLAAAIDEAVAAGANVINISGGEASPSGTAEPRLVQSIEGCQRQGVLVVAAAGNGGCGSIGHCDCLHVPGALPSVLAVGAMDGGGQPLEFSNCGSIYRTQGLLAPGKNIPGAVPGDGVAEYSGTSFATAIVSGAAALLMSLQRKQGVTPNADSIRDALLKSVDPCDPAQDDDCRRLLAGRMNLRKAIAILNQGEFSMPSESRTPVESPCGCATSLDPETDLALDDTVPGDESIAIPTAVSPRESSQRVADRPATRPANQLPRSMSRSMIQPARCMNETEGALVYVIGQLGFDFGTTGNRTSLNNNFAAPKGLGIDIPLDITSPFGLLAYLLGYRVIVTKPKNNGSEEHSEYSTEPTAKKSQESEPLGTLLEVCGHLHDAAFVNWVLNQAGCPKYVIRPSSTYAEAAYLEFIRFLIEQCDFIQYLYMPNCDHDKQKWYCVCDCDYHFQFQLRGDCLRAYYCCHGGEVCPRDAIAQPRREYDLHDPDHQADPEDRKCDGPRKPISAEELAAYTGSSLTAAEYIAVAGEICGSATLLNGQTLPAITPSLRSCASWSTAMLLDAVQRKVPLTPEEVVFLAALSRTLGEQTRNDGRSPEERALNFITANLVMDFSALMDNPIFRRILGVTPNIPGSLLTIGFDNWTIAPAPCREPDTLPYDVTLVFYNTQNLLPSRVFVSYTVNVADVNPVAGEFRLSIRR